MKYSIRMHTISLQPYVNIYVQRNLHIAIMKRKQCLLCSVLYRIIQVIIQYMILLFINYNFFLNNASTSLIFKFLNVIYNNFFGIP